MKRFRSDCYAFAASAGVALFAGCGGSQPPIGAPGAMLQCLDYGSRLRWRHKAPFPLEAAQ
jgi:hypothetical protein